MQKITPFFWLDTQAEEAANFYVSLFNNRPGESKKKSEIGTIARYEGKDVVEVSGKPEGSVMTVEFILDGQEFGALNGGPQFKFSGAISFVINCESQEEVDYFWGKLMDGGQEQQCGWLTDKFGVTWQVVPVILNKLLNDPDKEKAQRVMQAMLKMVKLDIPTLKKAAEGK